MASGPPDDHAAWAFPAGTDADLGTWITRLLHSLPAPPRLLGLGEPTHGEEAFPRARNEIFRHLVEHEGYRSIAIESDCLAALTVDEYVTEGAGTLETAMREGFSHGFGESAANRDLVRWMRDHNRDRPTAERLRFFGFDGPLEITGAAAPRPALTALHAYLAARLDAELLPCTADTLEGLAGPDERWTDPAAAMDPARSIGGSPEAERLRLLADDLLAVLAAESPHLIAASSPGEWWRAELYGRTAAGLLRYHAWMAEPSPDRMGRLMRQRDSMMAGNLVAIARDQPRRGPTLVFAHNSHLQREKSEMQTSGPVWGGLRLEWWSAGAIAATRLGDDGYAFVCSALGAAPHRGLQPPPAGTVEGLLSTLPHDRCLIDPAAMAAALCDRLGELTARTDGEAGRSIFPLEPAHLPDVDGLLFVKETAPAG
jgi:erythromycin esterase-like protein